MQVAYRRRLTLATPCGCGPRVRLPHAAADGSRVPIARPPSNAPVVRRLAALLPTTIVLFSPTAKAPPVALGAPEIAHSKSVVPVAIVDHWLPLKRKSVPASPVAYSSDSVSPQIDVSDGVVPGCSELQLVPL